MSEIQLEQMKVSAKVAMSREAMQGLQHVEFSEMDDMMTNQLVRSLQAFIFAEPAGEKVRAQRTDWVKVNMPLRPRWIPRWLWSRIPVRQAKFILRTDLSVEPMWTYPSASIQVPDLGPQRFLVRESVQTYRSWLDR